jgi:hypothetical protein
MRVEGENPLNPDLKGFGVRCSGTQMTRDAYCYALSGGAPRCVAPSEPSNHGHRSVPEKPLGVMWCDSLLSLVLFR